MSLSFLLLLFTKKELMLVPSQFDLSQWETSSHVILLLTYGCIMRRDSFWQP